MYWTVWHQHLQLCPYKSLSSYRCNSLPILLPAKLAAIQGPECRLSSGKYQATLEDRLWDKRESKRNTTSSFFQDSGLILRLWFPWLLSLPGAIGIWVGNISNWSYSFEFPTDHYKNELGKLCLTIKCCCIFKGHRLKAQIQQVRITNHTSVGQW